MYNLPVALIPAYKPSPILPEIVIQLMDSGIFQAVICIDDGSGTNYNEIFDKLKQTGACVLRHSVNLGKGAAIRTGLNEFLTKYPESAGTVTLDADGQHLSSDAIKIGAELIKRKNELILGKRTFNSDEIPLRSRFGNALTRYVFSFMTGLTVTDTQTGLRGIPASFVPELLRLKTSGYDFELDMLILTKTGQIKITEIPIATVYENGNSTSHFNPIFDSLRIYFVFLRYAWVGFLSFLIDFGIFMLFLHIFQLPIASANVGARGISSIFNFILNRQLVFKSKGNIYKEYAKYFGLMLYVIIVNTLIVYFAYNYITKFSAVVKISAEIVTFFITFLVSRSFVFKDRWK